MAGAKVPAAVVAALVGLAAGLALGVLLMGVLGYQTKAPPPPQPPAPGSPDDPRVKGGGGPGPGMRAPGRAQTSAKVQLADLVGKIDRLTAKPLALTLDDEQRRKVREQLAGLDSLNDLGEEDAQKRLDALLAVLAGQKETLDAVNYRWQRPPGGPPAMGGPPPPPANPFKEGASHEQVRSLQERLEPRPVGAKGP
jgi:hypothetical protein